MRLTTHLGRVLACSALLAISACGGGGGGGNEAPVAAARLLSAEAIAHATTRFDTAGTSDPDGQLVQRTWNYGDGESGTDDSHVYARPGIFIATYTVTDDRGATASTTVQVNVAKCSAAGTREASRPPPPTVTVCVQTNLGEMVFALFPDDARQTVENFLRYVDSGFYSGTLFHRVLPVPPPNTPANPDVLALIQGGGFTSGMTAKTPGAPIPLESKPPAGRNQLRNLGSFDYTIGMARDPNVPDSATSQFYVNLDDNPSLDYNPSNPSPNGYAVFGQVISGATTVDAIGRVTTGTRAGFNDVPVQDVVVRGMLRLP